MLEKNRAKRATLEETLQHKWFADYKEIHEARSGKLKDNNGLDNKFEAFTLTEPNSPKLTQDLNDMKWLITNVRYKLKIYIKDQISCIKINL